MVLQRKSYWKTVTLAMIATVIGGVSVTGWLLAGFIGIPGFSLVSRDTSLVFWPSILIVAAATLSCFFVVLGGLICLRRDAFGR